MSGAGPSTSAPHPNLRPGAFQYNGDPLRFHEDNRDRSRSSSATPHPPSPTPELDREHQPHQDNTTTFLNALAEMNANMDRNFDKLISALERSGHLTQATMTAASTRTSAIPSKPPKKTTLSKARPPEEMPDTDMSHMKMAGFWGKSEINNLVNRMHEVMAMMADLDPPYVLHSRLTLRDAVDVCALAFSPGGNLLAAGTKSGLLRIFALDNKYPPASFQLSSAITALIWGRDPNTEMLFIGEVNAHLHYVRRSLTWSAALSSQYDPLITMKDLQGPITALEISNHVRLLFVGDGGDIVVFPLDNINRRGPLMTQSPPPEKEDSAAVISGLKVKDGPEEAVVVVGYLEHGIRAYNIHRDTVANITSLNLCWTLSERRGHYFASWDVHKRQQYWLTAVYNLYDGIELYWTDPINEPKTAQYRGQLIPTTGWGHRNMVLLVGILTDGQWLIYGGAEGNTFIIDPNTGREIQRLNNHGDLGCSVFCSAIWADNDNGVERIALGTTGGLTGSITVYEYRDTTPRRTPLLTSPSPARSPKSVKIALATSSSASECPYPSSDIKPPHQNQSWKSASVPLSMIGCFVAVIMASIAIAVSYYGSPMTSRHKVVSQQVSKPTSSNTVTVIQPTSSDTVTVIVPPHTTTHTMTVTVSPVIVSPQPTSSDTVVVVSTHTMTDTMTITVSPDIMTVTVFPKTSVLEDSWKDSWTCSANNHPTTETMTVIITESATMERQTETVSPTMDLHDFSVALGSSEWGQGISRAIQKIIAGNTTVQAQTATYREAYQ
ncbi:hypothetical protein D9758_018958 [Tetrapyrgos nigripes]|uniref:Uncharacterized protein n=1 Tax=Tetrapyrgos nigripes TaxID=182062 RepID=A0A8H5BP68_9AGAR|nr:hypothetical protein D9758_018958 [Tetrapyrgos nigripes]